MRSTFLLTHEFNRKNIHLFSTAELVCKLSISLEHSQLNNWTHYRVVQRNFITSSDIYTIYLYINTNIYCKEMNRTRKKKDMKINSTRVIKVATQLFVFHWSVDRTGWSVELRASEGCCISTVRRVLLAPQVKCHNTDAIHEVLQHWCHSWQLRKLVTFQIGRTKHLKEN